ncbi:MAG: hypothetical protein MJH09_08330 [Cetobacterium sp.]|nr:hypothetical protein [Cetobacterium sp.]
MENIKKIIKEILTSIDKTFLFRQYFFAIVFFFIMSSMGINSFYGYIVLIINTILYPFAVLTFDSAISFIMDNQVFILPVFLMIFVKILKFCLIYVFTILIAPISIIYILIRNRIPNK